MSSLLDSERYTLKQVAQQLNVHIASVWRWVLHGVRGRKLATILIGGRRFVLRHDLEAFLAAGAYGASHQRHAIADRAAAAGKLLDAFGITENAKQPDTTVR